MSKSLRKLLPSTKRFGKDAVTKVVLDGVVPKLWTWIGAPVLGFIGAWAQSAIGHAIGLKQISWPTVIFNGASYVVALWLGTWWMVRQARVRSPVPNPALVVGGVEVSPPTAILPGENGNRLESLQSALSDCERNHAVASREADELRSALARARGDNEVLSGEASKHTFALIEKEKQLRQWYWRARYDEDYPDNLPDKIDILAGLQLVLPRLDEHIGLAKGAAHNALSVLTRIAERMSQDHEKAEVYLVGFLQDNVLSRLESSVALLEESKKVDPRAALWTFYRRYHLTRHWIANGLRIGKMGSLGPIAGFDALLSADGALTADVAKLRYVRHLEPIMQALPHDFLTFTFDA